jgi:hypothetical protein
VCGLRRVMGEYHNLEFQGALGELYGARCHLLQKRQIIMSSSRSSGNMYQEMSRICYIVQRQLDQAFKWLAPVQA